MADAKNSRVFVCQHCNIEFAGRKRKFCSPACRAQANGKTGPNALHECQSCGKSFAGRKRKYCSQQCQSYAKACRERLAIRERRKGKSCGTCDGALPITRRKYCSSRCSRAAEVNDRNFRLEWIRRVAARGECGPPTRDELISRQHLQQSTKYVGVDQSPDQRLVEQNASDAWRHHTKVMASDEWCERYYAATGKPWRNPRLSSAERYRIRYRQDKGFAASERMRRQVNKAMKRDGVAELMRGAIKRNGSSRQVERLLGYDIKTLMDHLERQFTRGMSWSRFIAGDIHIDHITPQAAFDLTDAGQWKACWCLSNLRPCWARENLEKSDAIMFLM